MGRNKKEELDNEIINEPKKAPLINMKKDGQYALIYGIPKEIKAWEKNGWVKAV